jgi:hypothetical protein
MQYRQYAPAESLRNLVRYYWSLEGRQFSISRLSILSFADRYPRLIFQDIDCFEPIINDETGEEMPLCYLKGVRTRPVEVFMHGAFSHFGVSFYPHALTTFFGMGADELTNQMPDINMIYRCNLAERLRNRTQLDRVAVLNNFLLEKMAKVSLDFTVQSIVHKKGGVVDMEMPASPRISERQLQRRFKKQVGVPLKRYERISRFELALNRLTKVDYSELTSIAFELGYTDQSHFIREFQEFAGMSPYNFVRNKSVAAESSSFLYI